ncbi:MAG: acyltransferase family protein, partial [Lachnospiraceae bacterium]|nr:acyltransferase family protein [Lachnospiraceae bacterium]
MNQKLKSMDIIKGIGIIMIIIVHNRHFIMQDMSGLRPLINFGQMGCQLFFFVSGFTLCLSWEHITDSKSDRFHVSKGLRFILRRYVRLAPGFLIFMMVNLGLNILFINILNFPSGFIMNRKLPAILTNIFFVHGLFPDYINSVFPGGWYIGTSFLLYITFPLLYAIFNRLRRIHTLCMTAVPAVLLLLNCVLLQWMSKMPENELYLGNNTFLYFFFTNHIVCFCLGILLFFQKTKCPLMISLLFFVLSTGICIYLFMNPYNDYTYAVIPSFAGLSAYWLASALIHFEKKSAGKYSFLADCGRNSYG